jgi:IS30 family transposase
MTTPASTGGRLTADDHERIAALAERGWKCGRIGQVIGRKKSTVYWHMLRHGLVERVPSAGPRRAEPYRRGDRWVYPYSDAEDAFLEQQRAEGRSFKDIADAASARFGKPRNHHSVFVRLTILAATADATT